MCGEDKMSLLEILEQEAETEAPEDFNENELYAIQEASEKLANIEAKRRKRIKMCGTWIYYRNPNTGMLQTGIFKCNNWRNNECPVCAEERASNIKKNMINHVSINNVALLKIDEEAATKIIRKIRNHAKKNDLTPKLLFERFPTDDKDYLFVNESIAQKIGLKASKVTATDVLSMDWKKISILTDGRNKSGNMSEPEKSEKEYELINVEEFSTNADPDAVKELEKKVIYKTRYYDPKTPDQVEKYIRIRNNLLKKALKKAGHSITFKNRTKSRCQISSINWLKETKEFLIENKLIKI